MLIAVVSLLGLSGLLPALRSFWYGAHIALVAALAALIWPSLRMSPTPPDVAFLMQLALLHMLSINLITFAAYAADKRAARRGGWRIPERRLHAFALIGGSPAAFLARAHLRHKSAKREFRHISALILALQVVVLCALLAMLSLFV